MVSRVVMETKSICPICFDTINAEYYEQNSSIFFKKNCKAHGDFSELIYRNSNEFLDIYRYYNLFIKRNQKFLNKNNKKELTIFPSYFCNMKCSICITKSSPNSNKFLSLAKLEPIIKRYNNSVINIMGGEPTIYPYLEQLITLIKKNKNIPVLFTNGIKLMDPNYVKWLKTIGIRHVNLQFESSELFNEKIRGDKKLFQKKIKVLENLSNKNFNVSLEITVNEDNIRNEVKNSLLIASKFKIINNIIFRPFFKLGKSANKNSLVLDDILIFAGQSTKGILSKDKILDFQKLLLISPFYLHKFKLCHKHRYYMLIRDEDRLNDIHRYLNLNSELFKVFLKVKNPIKSNIYYYAYFLPKILKPSFLKIIFKRLFMMKSPFILIDFNGRCDIQTYDENDICDSAVFDNNCHFYSKFNIADIMREKNFNVKNG